MYYDMILLSCLYCMVVFYSSLASTGHRDRLETDRTVAI